MTSLLNTAEYQVIANWEDPKEQAVSTFETSLDDWVAASGVHLNRSTTYAKSGKFSVQLLDEVSNNIVFDDTPGFDTFTFGSDASPDVGLAAVRTLTGLEVGTAYTVFGWAYIPDGARFLKLTCDDFDFETSTNVFKSWVYLETSFTADADTKDIKIYTIFTEGTIVDGPYIDDFSFKVSGEDITSLVLNNRGTIDISGGRDFARALSAVTPAESAFDMINEDRRYSPNNPLSPIHSRPATNTQIQIRAFYEGRFYILYNGVIDEFIINQELPDFSTISVTSFDVMGKLAATNISTGLYPNVRTGEAIGIILDEIGWPSAKRKMEFGATVIDWWWEDETNALDAIKALLSAEGLPSIIYVDDVGDFVFRDRHHRYISSLSTIPTAIFAGQDLIIE